MLPGGPQAAGVDARRGDGKDDGDAAGVGLRRLSISPGMPSEATADGYRVEIDAKQQRLEGRRREQATAAFQERYARRSGIESTNSGLKRRLGLGQLRVRGSPSVFHSILLKITGWNLLRAATSTKVRELVAQKVAAARQAGCVSLLAPPWRVCAARRAGLAQRPSLDTSCPFFGQAA